MSRTPPIHPAIPPEPRQGGGCVAIVIYAILFFAGMIILYAFFWEPFYYVITARSWIETPCVIVASQVEPVGEKGSKSKANIADESFRPQVKYRYQHLGESYYSERIWFTRWGADTYSDVKAVVNRYPQGRLLKCFVNPNDPQFAVLERGWRPQLLIALVPLALVLVGAGGIVSRVTRSVATPDPRFRPLQHRPPGTAITHHARSGWAPLIFTIIFGAFWNFVVSFLVREVISNWRDGVPGCHGWFLTIFAIPFVLVGAMFVVLPFYLLLKLFNPRPTLTLMPAEAPLGGAAELSWRFSGRYDRIHRLRISLEGREEATYNSGDDTSTAREVFMTVPLVDTSKQAEIRGGKAPVAIPGNAVPTFTAPHNKIAWAIRVCGEIRGWPDVDEEFEFVVLPALQTQVEPAEAAAS